MSDDKKKTGKADRSRVSTQRYEVSYLVEKYGLPHELVKGVVQQLGPSRRPIEKMLKLLSAQWPQWRPLR